MSTPTFPQTPSDPSRPTPSEPMAPNPAEPTAPTPAEPTIPLPPETAPAPASASDSSTGVLDRTEEDAAGSAELDADNAAEQDVVDAVAPGGEPD